jgi:NAD(P)-dependent dehydrogenase (short-subunit alcohol dehydrogenase family)
MLQNRTALIFGASGITGWAIAREAVQYPSADAYARIIGLTNRPLDRKTARLPDDEKIQLVSGLDLTAGVDSVTSALRAIDGIADITDVYFAGKKETNRFALR